MLRETVGHLRDLPRYRQILATLIRYGYRDIVVALHLEGLARPIERAALGDDNIPPRERPMRLRMVCEDLGPTFVKLGQILSTRPDLLPEAYTDELAKLRDAVKPFPFEEVEAILTEELGRPPAEVFREIDPEAVAAASISQVHRATLPDGTPVAIKVRRPGIEKVAQADLDILKNLAQLAERRLPFIAAYGPVALVREFDRTLKRELDLAVERRTMERCRLQLSRSKEVHVPRVFPAFCTPRVLTMEFVGGVGVTDLEGLRSLWVDPAEVAKRGARLLATQIFSHGLFHADPHPGNLRVLPGGVIAPLDYGMFGQLELATREHIADLLMGLLGQDTDRVLRSLNALDIRGENVDARSLRRDVGELVLAYADLTLDSVNLGKILSEVVDLFRSHHLHIPPDLVLLIRALVTIESVGRTLDPHFDIAAQLEPFLRDLALRRYSPRRLLSSAGRTAEDVQRVATLLPDVMVEALEQVKRGELTVKFDLQHFEQLVRQLTSASHTLAASLVIAGLLVGSSLIVRADGRLLSMGYAGYAIAFVMGLGLVWRTIRGR